jgi:hypothetical protein
MENKTCWGCALFSKEHHACLRTRMPALSTDSCSHWISELPICDVCGQVFLPPATFVIEDNGLITVICPNCDQHRGRCPTCECGGYCDFKENTECTLPVMIQQTMRQGNMVMSRTVPNLARVEETCKKNCKCWDVEQGCCSRGCFGTCGKYEMKGKKVDERSNTQGIAEVE